MNNPIQTDATLWAEFDRLVDLDAPTRAREIERIAAASPTLAEGLRRLLAADERVAGRSVDELSAVVRNLIAETGSAPFAAGRRFGPFALVERIGEGGMAEVWRAVRVDALAGDTVALKLMGPGIHRSDLVQRFSRERAILSGLDHPNIARFIDGGVSDDGVPWFAMALVEGQPITAHATARRLDARARVAMVAEVADAVAYAQNRLIVHRDLKPSNVLVDADGRTRLLDFGIAKLLSDGTDSGAFGAARTATGLRALTPAYAAPEQILGEPVQAATDVYALGVILFELLTGALPHTRATSTLETLAEQVRTEVAPRPSAAIRKSGHAQGLPGDPARAARMVNGELDAIVLKALKREPDRRYPSAAALADDLRRWLAGRPVQAQPDSARYRLSKFVARNRLAVASAVAVSLALVGGAGLALWQAAEARAQSEIARSEARRASVIRDFFVDLFESTNPATQRRGANLSARDWVGEAADRIEGELLDAPLARAEIEVTLAMALIGFGDRERAKTLVQRALPVLAQAGRDEAGSHITALMLAIEQARFEQDLDLSARLIDVALARLPEIDDPDARRDNSLQLKTYQLTLANAHGDYPKALAIGQALLRERIAAFGETDVRVAVDWYNIGVTLSLLERHVEAGDAAQRTLDILKANPTSPESRQALAQLSLCVAYFGTGSLTAAREAAASSVEIAARTLGVENWVYQVALSCAARAAIHSGDLAAAGAVLDQLPPPDKTADPSTGLQAKMLRAEIAWRQGRYAELEQTMTELRAMTVTQGARTAQVILMRDALEAAHLALLGDDVDAAVARIEGVLAALAALPGERGVRTAQIEIWSAAVLRAAGRVDEAEQIEQRARTVWAQAWAAHRHEPQTAAALARIWMPSAPEASAPTGGQR